MCSNRVSWSIATPRNTAKMGVTEYPIERTRLKSLKEPGSTITYANHSPARAFYQPSLRFQQLQYKASPPRHTQRRIHFADEESRNSMINSLIPALTVVSWRFLRPSPRCFANASYKLHNPRRSSPKPPATPPRTITFIPFIWKHQENLPATPVIRPMIYV